MRRQPGAGLGSGASRGCGRDTRGGQWGSPNPDTEEELRWGHTGWSVGHHAPGHRGTVGCGRWWLVLSLPAAQSSAKHRAAEPSTLHPAKGCPAPHHAFLRPERCHNVLRQTPAPLSRKSLPRRPTPCPPQEARGPSYCQGGRPHTPSGPRLSFPPAPATLSCPFTPPCPCVCTGFALQSSPGLG